MDTVHVTPGNVDPTLAKTITINDIELRTHTKRRRVLARYYYVELRVGDSNTPKSTKEAKETGSPICWDDKWFFDGDDHSVLVIKVYQKNNISKDKLIGSLADTVGGILRKLKDGVFEGPLRKDTPDESGSGFSIKFLFTADPREGVDVIELRAADAVIRGTKALDSLNPAPKAVGLATDAVSSIATEVQSFEATWGVLLKRMALFNTIVADIVAIHPYTSLAWSVISAANQVLVNQKNRDEYIIRLAGAMSDVFAFVHDAEPLKGIKEYAQTITQLIQQVTECGYFIAEYAKQKNFWIRTAKYTISTIDARITGYEDTLRALKTAFVEQITLQTGVTVVRMLNLVDHTAETIDLNDMPYAFGARYAKEKGCLIGTRESLILEICDVLNNPAEDAPRVCLLTGVAGSGKSAIAHSIARLYDGQQRLGSSYCFSSTDVARRNPENLFSTIARDLSDHDPQYKSALWRVVKDNRALRTSTSPMEQVDQFIIEPCKNLHTIGPLVIVIDALDESGDSASRRQLLRVLSTHFTENTLPANLRFLITARPESDILAAVSSSSYLIHKQMGNVPDGIVDGDIERFIHHSLYQYPELDSRWPGKEWCRLLVVHSQHLFQWASTACNFIDGDVTAGLDPCERLKILLEGDEDEFVHPLDKLYRTILERQFTLKSTRRRFHDVMAIVLALHEPLSLASLAILFGDGLKAREIIKPLGSLLDGALDEERPIRPLHTSFRDFLLDEARSLEFHIPILPHHSLALGRALLACMQAMLKFNMCNLTDSQLRNAAVPNLVHQVNKAITPSLSYSCQYWMSHLQHVECTLELLKEVTMFFKDFFPYWLEAISLLSLSSPLSSILSALKTCTILQTWSKDHEIVTLSSEAFKFIQVFAPVLRESTPHLYLSAMPQTPSSSPLHMLWSSHLQKHISVACCHPATWPIGILALEGHTADVNSVAYSADGRHIVSGSSDNTIRVWDATTGQCVIGPFQEHTDFIHSVVYSPDNKCIASGSSDNTIRIWDAITGQSVAGPFKNHSDAIHSIIYSPDGKFIASGSSDKTVVVCIAATGQLVAGPFEGHTSGVISVAYSHDGRHIISGSKDKTIRVWDVAMGQAVIGPLIGHTDIVTSVIYSPDGRQIVSSSWDATIRIWDAATGQCKIGPLQGHTDGINAIVYSPDGKHIVSASQDDTIRIWNAVTGQTEAGPFKSHTDYVKSIAYSPDGKHIVSSSSDKTIRVWSTTFDQVVESSFNGHKDIICSAVYSPDGKHIASGSRDKTIMVWDSTTGQYTVGPFQGHTGNVRSVAYSPDGRYIASGSWDNSIIVWDATSGQPEGDPFLGHTAWVMSVVFSSDGRYIVSGSTDNTIRVWNVATGQTVVGPFQGHTDFVSCVVYSPDSRHIASASIDNTVRVWDATTGQTIVGPFIGHTDYVRCVAYSPDSRHIASGSKDQTIRIWNAVTGHTVAGPSEGHKDIILSVSYSPDGKHIVSGSTDRTIWIWDAITGHCIAGPMQGHISGVTSVAFSPDGRYIVSGSFDCSIKVWRVQDIILFHDLLVKDGWIQSSNGTLFGWIAPWNRHAFHLPIHSLVIASDRSYPVQSDSSCIGESWISCWK